MTKKKETSIGFVSLSTYTAPEIVENKNEDFVSFGQKNDYFQYLIDRYNGSPTNNAIINGISQMIFGRGLDATDSSRKPNEYAQMKSLIKDDCLRKLTHEVKLTGQGALQIQFDSRGQKVLYVEHIPIETLRAKKCEKDDDYVKAYYYHHDWAEYKRNDVLKEIPAFGSLGNGRHAKLEILYIKPYKAGMFYYATPDYQGGLQYAELEEEISNFHLNNILNGMSPNMLINFNNGVPDKEAQREIERKIKNKYSGSSNAGNFILAFNDNKDSQATIEPVQLSDAHEQYQFLSDESMRKIMVAHRVVSPMLLGIKDNTGLGNNADELKQASILMDNIVIKPFQDLIIENLNRVLAINGIALKLYFKTLQPLEFTDLDNVQDEETREVETGVKLAQLSKEDKGEIDLTDEEFESLLEHLQGEVVDDEWELVDEREYSQENESVEDWAKKLIKPKETALQKLSRAITSKPSKESYLDKSIYKVRYEYAEKYSSANSRGFCKAMMGRTSRGVVYRLEDIDKASREGVNRRFGHKGQPMDLFKYKGGPYCGHYWKEALYRLKKKTDGTYVEDKALSSSQEVDSIPKSYTPRPAGHKKAKIAPKDMENQGHHPNYKG